MIHDFFIGLLMLLSLITGGAIQAPQPQLGLSTFVSSQVGSGPSNGEILQTNGSTSSWVSLSSISSGPTSTDPVMGSYFVATSTSATSTFAGSIKIATSTGATSLYLGWDGRPLVTSNRTGTVIKVGAARECTTIQCALAKIPYLIDDGPWRIELDPGTYDEDVLIGETLTRWIPVNSPGEHYPLQIRGGTSEVTSTTTASQYRIKSVFVNSNFGSIPFILENVSIFGTEPYDNESGGIAVYGGAAEIKYVSFESGINGLICYGARCDLTGVDFGTNVLSGVGMKAKHGGMIWESTESLGLVYPTFGTVAGYAYFVDQGQIFTRASSTLSGVAGYANAQNGFVYNTTAGNFWNNFAGFTIQGNFGVGSTTPGRLFVAESPDTNPVYQMALTAPNMCTGCNTGFLIGQKDANQTAFTLEYTHSAIKDNRYFNIKPTEAALGTGLVMVANGNVGISTTSPFAKFTISAISGDVNQVLFNVSSSTSAYATTSLFSISNTGSTTLAQISSSILKTDSNGTIVAATIGTDYQNFQYLFPNNATTTGLGLYASTTIGDGGQATGLTISGGATTTGSLVVGNNTANVSGTILKAEGGDIYVGNEANAAQNIVFRRNAATIGQIGTNNAALSFVNSNSAGFNFFNQNASTILVKILNTGLSGFGTTTPYAQLAASSTSAFPTLAIEQKSTGPSAIFLGGNVGVGTTSPWRAVSVVGTAAYSSSLTSATAGTNQALCINSTTFEVIRDTTGTCTVSSKRFKHDIETLDISALDLIKKVRTVSFSPNEDDVADYKDQHIGLIAEEMEAIDPRLVRYGTDGLSRNLDEYANLGLIYDGMNELIAEVDSLKGGTFVSKVVRSSEENWQNILIGLLIAYVLYNEWRRKR